MRKIKWLARIYLGKTNLITIDMKKKSRDRRVYLRFVSKPCFYPKAKLTANEFKTLFYGSDEDTPEPLIKIEPSVDVIKLFNIKI